MEREGKRFHILNNGYILLLLVGSGEGRARFRVNLAAGSDRTVLDVQSSPGLDLDRSVLVNAQTALILPAHGLNQFQLAALNGHNTLLRNVQLAGNFHAAERIAAAVLFNRQLARNAHAVVLGQTVGIRIHERAGDLGLAVRRDRDTGARLRKGNRGGALCNVQAAVTDHFFVLIFVAMRRVGHQNLGPGVNVDRAGSAVFVDVQLTTLLNGYHAVSLQGALEMRDKSE